VREAGDPGWTQGETALVVGLCLVLAALLGANLAGRGVLVQLLLSDLVLLAAAGLVLALASRRPGRRASLGLAPRGPARVYLVAPLVYLPLFPALIGLAGLWSHLGRRLGWATEQEVLGRLLELDSLQLSAALVVAVLIGPALEEFLFRGFLQAALARWLGPGGGLVSTSALFAALHGLPGLPALFVISLFLGWLQLRTRCLWVPWSAHALNNAVTLAFALGLRSG
jgi:hypothetical protein